MKRILLKPKPISQGNKYNFYSNLHNFTAFDTKGSEAGKLESSRAEILFATDTHGHTHNNGSRFKGSKKGEPAGKLT